MPRHYYGVLYLIRGTLVALVPVIFAGTAMVQVLAMGTVCDFETPYVQSPPWHLGQNIKGCFHGGAWSRWHAGTWNQPGVRT